MRNEQKKRVLALTPSVQPPGGGSALGAWALQALQDHYDVTVLTWEATEVAAVNAAFGTNLQRDRLRYERVGTTLPALLDLAPVPLAFLKTALLMRAANRLLARESFDVVLGLSNELALDEPAIQYVHYPFAVYPRPDADYLWYHAEALVRIYRRLCSSLSGYELRKVLRNTTLVNSDWTGNVFGKFYDAPFTTLYPPVLGGFPEVPFDKRKDRFVVVGRLSPEKELEKVVEIVRRVRSQGHEIGLDIVGHRSIPRYARVIERLVAGMPWVTLHTDVSRLRLVEIVAQCRFGIHGMLHEHFGIAPAELQRAGCITFVPNDGGQREIVGYDDRVIYRSIDDAVAKIDLVLRDPACRAALAADVRERAVLFSEQRFMSELRKVVGTEIERKS